MVTVAGSILKITVRSPRIKDRSLPLSWSSRSRLLEAKQRPCRTRAAVQTGTSAVIRTQGAFCVTLLRLERAAEGLRFPVLDNEARWPCSALKAARPRLSSVERPIRLWSGLSAKAQSRTGKGLGTLGPGKWLPDSPSGVQTASVATWLERLSTFQFPDC